MNDLRMIQKEPLPSIDVYPDHNDILTWYFLIKGPESSEYKGGYYIGKIMYAPNYPFQPPNFMMLTPSGRFAINTKICLSNSGFHVDEWNTLWTTSSILMGLLSIMLDDKDIHGIGHLQSTPKEKEKYALESIDYNKKNHQHILQSFSRFGVDL